MFLGKNGAGCRGGLRVGEFLREGRILFGNGFPLSEVLKKGGQREGQRPQQQSASGQGKRSEEKKDAGPVEQGKRHRQDGFAGTSTGGIGSREGMRDKQGKQGSQGDEQKRPAQGKGEGEGLPTKPPGGLCRQKKRKEQGGKAQNAVGHIGNGRSRHPEKIVRVGTAASGEKGGIIGRGGEKGPSNKNGEGSQEKGGQEKMAIPARGAEGGIPVGG
jgi:hypothetical protein